MNAKKFAIVERRPGRQYVSKIKKNQNLMIATNINKGGLQYYRGIPSTKESDHNRTRSCFRPSLMRNSRINDPRKAQKLNISSEIKKEIDSAKLSCAELNLKYPKHVSIEVQNNFLFNGKNPIEYNEFANSSINTQVNNSILKNSTIPTQDKCASIEEMHFFYVNFYHHAKGMLNDLRDSLKGIANMHETIESVSDEDGITQYKHIEYF